MSTSISLDLATARQNLQKAAKDALQFQNACNFSGVEFSFHSACDAIRAHMLVSNTFDCRVFADHPVVYLFLSKLTSLTSFGDSVGVYYGPASNICEQIAAGNFESVESL